jgi:hypothetical protein
MLCLVVWIGTVSSNTGDHGDATTSWSRFVLVAAMVLLAIAAVWAAIDALRARPSNGKRVVRRRTPRT